MTVNEVAAIIVENYSKGSSHTARDEVNLIQFVENTTHRERFWGSLVKFSNNPYATYGTPEIRTFMVWILYMNYRSAYIIVKGRGDWELAHLGAA